jgi:peptide deformylase
VVDVTKEQDHPLAFVNPEIVEREGSTEAEEGCLSVPGIFDKLSTRAARIVVRALGRDGKPFELEANGLLAICIQHEMDHLEGKLFVDYLSELKRTRIRKKLEKERRERGSAQGTRERSKAPVI